MDEKFQAVEYEAASENIVFDGKKGDTYHETVLYHSTGPSTSQSVRTGFPVGGAHIYDDASVHLLPEDGQARSLDPVYEDPNLSQVCYTELKLFLIVVCMSVLQLAPEKLCPPQSIFETSGVYVPTEVR